jgi:two-component system, OmpR family, response regulator
MGNTKVLIIDDEMDFAEPLAARLNKRGLDCKAASGATEALNILEQKWLPDTVVIDLNMPEHDGLETLDMLKSRLPDGKFIMLTGHATTKSSIDGISKGLSAYLLKPVSIDILIETIEAALAETKDS